MASISVTIPLLVTILYHKFDESVKPRQMTVPGGTLSLKKQKFLRKTLLYSGTGRERERGAGHESDRLRAFHAYIIPLPHYPYAHGFQEIAEGLGMGERLKFSSSKSIEHSYVGIR